MTFALQLFESKTCIITHLVPDSFIPIGETTLDLCRLPKPAKNKDDVSPSLDQQMMAGTNANSVAISFPNDDIPTVNLFEAKRVYGFYPFIRLEDGQPKIAVSSGIDYKQFNYNTVIVMSNIIFCNCFLFLELYLAPLLPKFASLSQFFIHLVNHVADTCGLL